MPATAQGSNNFLPFKLDRTRYGIKETKLAKTYIEVLGLGPQSEDAYNLTKWKLPSASAKVVSQQTP
jgi:DNA ligase-4